MFLLLYLIHFEWWSVQNSKPILECFCTFYLSSIVRKYSRQFHPSVHFSQLLHFSHILGFGATSTKSNSLPNCPTKSKIFHFPLCHVIFLLSSNIDFLENLFFFCSISLSGFHIKTFVSFVATSRFIFGYKCPYVPRVVRYPRDLIYLLIINGFSPIEINRGMRRRKPWIRIGWTPANFACRRMIWHYRVFICG